MNGQNEQAAAIRAYRDCAVRILHATEDWKTTLVPHLLQFEDVRGLPASVVVLEVLTELDPEQQVESVVLAFQQIAVHGKQNVADSIDHLTVWLADPAHRAALQMRLEQATGDTLENLVVGMLRSGLADDTVRQTLTTRFGNDTINRNDVLKKLLDSLDDQPDLVQVVIGLIEHPALDASTSFIVNDGKRAEISLRAALNCWTLLREIPTRHQAGFRPLLQKLVQSDNTYEPQMAQQVLDAWK